MIASSKPVRIALRLARRAWQDLKISYESALATVHPNPIFVLGNQKSGTSAIGALLAQATALTATLDLQREIRRPTFPRVRAGELSFQDFVELNRLEFSRSIIKEPNLTFLFPQLDASFPHARTVIVVRDPRDNIRSMLDRVKLPGNQNDLKREQWRRLPPGWNFTIGSEWLGVHEGTYIERLAMRWNHAVDVYLDAPERMYRVPHREVDTSRNWKSPWDRVREHSQ